MKSIGISDEILKRINTIIYRFIWNPKADDDKRVTEKLKRVIINKGYECGGLNMIDIVKLQHSFLLKWGDRLIHSSNNSWKCIPLLTLKFVGGVAAFKSHVHSSEYKGLDLVRSAFWARVLKIWLDYNKVEPIPSFQNPSLDDPIFNNNSIRYKKKVIFNKRCIVNSIIFVKDFISSGRFMSFEEFDLIMNHTADTNLVYNTIYNALLPHQDVLLNSENENNSSFYFRDHTAGDINRKVFYELIIDKKIESVKTELRNQFSLEENDPCIWKMAYECTSETKLLELQYKILHNIYGTGYIRHKMKLREDDLCSFCLEVDTITHFFVSCCVAKKVWEEAEKLISALCGKSVELTETFKLLSILENNVSFSKELRRHINRIMLVCKKTISKYKYEKVGNIKLLLESQLTFRGLHTVTH